jgi:hypothetical protein
MITVDGKVTRNVSQFKKIGPRVQAELYKKSRDEEEKTRPNVPQYAPPALKENAVPNAPQRSQRNRELPKKLKDKVLCAR